MSYLLHTVNISYPNPSQTIDIILIISSKNLQGKWGSKSHLLHRYLPAERTIKSALLKVRLTSSSQDYYSNGHTNKDI